MYICYMKYYSMNIWVFCAAWLLAVSGMSQPVADFQASRVQGCAPVIVTFQDLSINAVSWHWDLGVSTSHLQNPGLIYLNPGSYTIRLIVTDASGAKDTLERVGYINAYGNPEVDFAASDTSVCAHELTQFSDLTNPGSGSITQWTWDFGDGTTSTLQHPAKIYTSRGAYPVSLTVSNQYGCSDEQVRAQYIDVNAPDVHFAADQTLACGAPLAVQFSNAGDSTLTHFWNFGDGTTASQANPLHIYNTVGSFAVTHVATDLLGCKDTLVSSGYINIGINNLLIEAEDSSVCQFDSVFFSTSAAASSSIVWYFGDGDSSTTLNPFHLYPQPGTYTVTSIISDPSGCSTTLDLPVVVNAFPVIGWDTQDTTLGCSLPFLVDFVDQSTGGVSWAWYFGDGTISTQQHPSHSYTTADSFHVNLVVTGAGGCSRGMRKPYFVKIREIQAGIGADQTGGCGPLTVAFSDTSYSPYPIVSWAWDFGDGTGSALQHPTHTYVDTGYYDVQLIVSNSQGCTDTMFKSAYISVGTLPTVDFVADTMVACALSEINFTNLSSHGDEFLWLFGDGDTAMSYHVSHGFMALGDIGVALIMSDRGCRDTLIRNNYVHILAPLPIMNISDKQICTVPADVQFTNLSIGADYISWDMGDSSLTTVNHPLHTYTQPGTYYVTLTAGNLTTGCEPTIMDSLEIKPVEINLSADNTRDCYPLPVHFRDSTQDAIRWVWQFGTGDSSRVRYPSYTYRAMGYYNVSLVVTNDIFCRDTLVMDSMIHALGVQANFTEMTPANGCAPLDVAFEDRSSGTGNVVSWAWDFGDGTTDTVQNPLHLYTQTGYSTVSLSVVDEDGCTDQVEKEDEIFVTFPVADFAIPHPVNCPDNAVTFVSNSLGTGLNYQWDFGDGGTAMLANPTHIYTAPGVYTVSLHVTDINGCDSAVVKTDVVTIAPLNAAFVVDTTYASCPPLQVGFTTDTSWVHPGIAWHWDFGNGATSTLPLPIHNYTTADSFDVRLIVSAPSGCTDTVQINDLIVIEGPTGSFTADPTEGCPGTSVNLSGTSSNSISFAWIFGDGSLGTGQQTTHVYTVPGTYAPVMVLQDTVGCEVVLPGEHVLVYDLPTIEFTTGNTVLCDSGTIALIDQSTSPDPITDWLWDFGDGATSTQQFPMHTYNQVGSYDVTLTLTTSRGCTSSLTKAALIQVVASPQPTVLVSDDAGCIPFSVAWTAPTQPGDAPIVAWEWDFGDGSQLSTLGAPRYTYFTAGNYLASVLVTDINGCTATAQKAIEAYPLPTISFVADDSMGCAPKTVRFIDLTPQAIDWQWNFGDGGTTTGANPAHLYARDGVYDVTLAVTDLNGCRDVRIQPNYIHLDHPIADFTISDTVICPGSAISFIDHSRSDTMLQHWQWYFGDGGTAAGAAVSHVYSQPGYYDLSLMVTDVFGCRDTATIPAYLEVLVNIQPETVEIRDVSVLNDSEVRVRFEAYANSRQDFVRYILYRQNPTGGWTEVAIVPEVSQLEIIDQELDTRSEVYCYIVAVENYCGLISPLATSTSHCTIELQATPLEDAIALSWNAYVGWPQVEGYQIYRVTDYTPGRGDLIASLPGTASTFLDTEMFCYQGYSYRVLAIGRPSASAYSDTTFAAPIHFGPADSVQVMRATVENNAFINVEWEMPPIERLQMIAIERDAGGGFVPLHSQAPAGINNQKYQDMGVDVAQRPYAYRVFGIDSCGDYTPLGLTGKTVHLQVERRGGDVHLSWTPYMGWEKGVATYSIERYDENAGIWVKIDEVPGNSQHFQDLEADAGFPMNSYRVIASEQDGYGTTSFSNEENVILDPDFYVANAFTPNGDGVNDFFVIEGLYLEQVSFLLFNRWGQQIYETNTLADGWDGTMSNGNSAPEGVYVFFVKGLGYTGLQIQRSGTITLIR